MSKLISNLKTKKIVLAIVIVLTISLGAAETNTEDKFFTNEQEEVNSFEGFLLQPEPTQEETFSELVEGVNNEDGEIAIEIYRRFEDGARTSLTEGPIAQEDLDDSIEGSDADGGRITVESGFTFPETELNPEDSIEIDVLAAFEGDDLELLQGNEEATFTTGSLFSTGINNHEATIYYDIEFDDGQGGQTDGEIRFYWGDDTNSQDEEVSQIQDFTYEIPPPEIELLEPEEGEVFSSGEEITYEIDDEFREINQDNTFYTLDGETQDFDNIEDTTYTIDTSEWEEGEREIEVVAENEDGATETQQNTFTIDDTPPEVDIETPEEGEVTNENEITIEYTATDENEIENEEYQINDEEREPITSGDTIEIEEDGEYDLTIFAEDEAGNEGQDTNTFTIDTEDPELEIIEPENITYNDFEVPLEIEASGEETIEYEVVDQQDNTVKETQELENEETTLEFEERDTYTVEVTAEDEAGNTNTQEQTFTVDPEPALFETSIVETNSPVEEGEELTIEVEIENTGDLEDTRDVEFSFDETIEETREITLVDGEITEETFNYDTTDEETGNYQVEVNSGEEEEEIDQVEVAIGLPELQLNNIQIFDVTNEQDQRENGELQAEDTELLEIEQTERNTEYRFEFVVENIGDSAYKLEKSEIISHTGINTEWVLEDIFVQTDQETIEGGEKEEEQIEWNKTEEAEIPEDTEATFAYIIQTDTTESETYEAEFEIVSEEQDINLLNQHIIEKTKYGYLETTLLEPPTEFTASEDSSFNMIAETTCLEGECGELTQTSRYNETNSAPNTQIPEEEAEPLYTTDSNPLFCEEELTHEDTCEAEWNIEVTGDTEESVSIDVLTSSDLEEVEETNSETSTFTIQDSLILDVEFDEINFGTVSPGKDEQPALENTLGYNVTIPEESLDAEEIRVSGTHLNNSINDGYDINVNNIGYSLENDASTANELTQEQQILTENINAGTQTQTFYWLDIPTGITADTYRGVINFEAIE